ncbi:MAG: regulatory iron-sulfur-containing complex subunit RicT [Lentisphaeria bacterium]
MKQLYHVIVAPGLCYECLGDEDLNLKKGDKIVVKCERFIDFARVNRKCDFPPVENADDLVSKYHYVNKGRHIEGQKIAEIQRVANAEDEKKCQENEVKADSAHRSTLDRVRAHKLEMKLIHTHYSLDRKMIVFQFSANGRIDFRELLRDLSGLLRVRVELRQVGVRDEAAILGGIGICGRPFCCAGFLPSFNSINVKMAKMQGLSLTPQNISGCCGRLKCCLQYEAENYRSMAKEQKKTAPIDKKDSLDGENTNEKTAPSDSVANKRPSRQERNRSNRVNNDKGPAKNRNDK